MKASNLSILRWSLTLFLAAFVTGIVSPAAAEPVGVLAMELPPFVFAKGEDATGPAVEFARHVLEAAHIDVAPKIVSTRRLVQSLKEGNMVSVMMGRTPAREADFAWIGEIYTDYLTFVTSDKTRLDSLDAARAVKRIGVAAGSFPAALLKNKGFSNLDEVSSEDLNAKKLLAGRIDAWLVSAAMARYTLRRASTDQNAVTLGNKIIEVHFWMAASKNLPAKTIEKLKAAFVAAKADGTYAKFAAQIR